MINEVTAANRYTAAGGTVFAYTFEIADQAHIEVSVDNVVKSLTTDYEVSGVGASGGGNVTFITAPANGAIVTLLRNQPAEQQSSYSTTEAFPATRIERDFDKLVMSVQELKEQLARVLMFTRKSIQSGAVDEPTVGYFARAKVGGGVDWANLVSAGSITVPVPVGQGGTGATTAADARTNLGIAVVTEMADTDFRVTGSGDNTKKLAFEVDGFTAGAVRVITPPDADLTLPEVTAAGDLAIASASDVLTRLPVGAGGSIPMSRAAASLKLAYVAALNKAIYGFTYANSVGDVTNDLDIAAGGAMDATGAYWIAAEALTKQSDVAWAVGTNAGGLDTGVAGNSDYYIWTIARSDTGVTDYLFSLSSTAPTMPANYDFKRLIGWFKRVGGAIVAFHTYETEGGGLELLWDSPTLDINLAATLTTSRRTDAIKVPLNFSVVANLNLVITDGGAAIVWVYCPDQTDLAPSGTAAPLSSQAIVVISSIHSQNLVVRTSATGTIAARGNTTVDNYRVATLGFTWARRN